LALLIGSMLPALSQWVQVPSGTTSSLKDIFFTNDSVGFCVGGGDRRGGSPNAAIAVILRSVDGGEIWTTVLEDTLAAFEAVAAKGDTVVCFGRNRTTSGMLWSSYDNGASWSVHILERPLDAIRNLAFCGADPVFTYLQDMVKLDLGTHSLQTLFTPNATAGFGMDGDRIYLMSMDRTLHRSTDSGSNWETIPCILADSAGLFGESFLSTLLRPGSLYDRSGPDVVLASQWTDLGVRDHFAGYDLRLCEQWRDHCLHR
jgi:hypothetical protein